MPRPVEGTGVSDARSHQTKRPDPQTHDLPGEVYGRGLGMCRKPPDLGAISGLSSYLTAARQGALGLHRESPELDNMASGGDERRSRDDPASCRQVGAVYPGGLPLFSSAASRTACLSNRNAARSSAERRAMKPVR